MSFSARFNLTNLNGRNGFILNGIDAFDVSGFSVSSAGDINGDGLDDILIGAPFINAVPFVNVSINDPFVVYGEDGTPGGILAETGEFIPFEEERDIQIIISGITVDYEAPQTSNNLDGETYVVFGSDQGFEPRFDLSSLDGSNGFVLDGINWFDSSGSKVSSAGDINGDGFDDMLISAPTASPNGDRLAGETYLVFGSDQDFDARVDLESLNGSNGFVLNGTSDNERSGLLASNAGDFNGDGFDDILIGTSKQDDSSWGRTYIVFGGNQAFSPSFNLSSLNGSNGFVLNAANEGDQRISSVSNAGDVNGDSFDDILIGVRGAAINGNNSVGQTYVVFGSDQSFNPSFDLADLDGSNGFVLNGIETLDLSGYSVSSAGDVNGDGISDILIGAPGVDSDGNEEAGEIYVVFGRNQGFSSTLNLDLLDGSNGFVISSSDAWDFAGANVGSAGDFNGDGFDDILISSDFFEPNYAPGTGEVYVVFGSDQGFAPRLNLSSLKGSRHFILDDIDVDDVSNFSASGAGDINGDGFDDILVGSHRADPKGNLSAGETYVIFGGLSNYGSDFSGDQRPDIVWRNTLDGTNTVWAMDDTRILQGQELPPLGTEWELAASADFNNDGQADLFWRNINSGENIVWYMKGTAIIGGAVLPSLGMEWELGATGDFNNDGQEDLIWRHRTAGLNVAWYLDQGKVQRSKEFQSLDNAWQLAAAGDFNSDGNEDLVWRHSIDGTNAFWYADGDLNMIGGDVFSHLPDQDWQITGSADMNRDGYDDLLWRNDQTGSTVSWQMQDSVIRRGQEFAVLPGSHWHMVV